jgi:hypothetical protein
MTAREALHLGTRGGAAVLGRKDIGSLEVGKCADFFAVNLNRLEFTGMHDPVSAIVFGQSVNVDYTVVNGKFIVSEGQLVTVDRGRLIEKHNKAAKRLTGWLERLVQMDALLNIVVDTIVMLGRGIPGLVTAGLAAMLVLLALVRREPGMMVLAVLLCIPSIRFQLMDWLPVVYPFAAAFPFIVAYAIGQDDPIFMWGLAIPPFLFLAYFVFNLVVKNFAGV